MSRQAMPQEDRDIFAANLERFRDAHAWSQAALARRLDMTERAVARYLAAQQYPDTPAQRRISKLTGWTAEEMRTPNVKVKKATVEVTEAEWEIHDVNGTPVAFKKGTHVTRAQLEGIGKVMLTPEKREALAKSTKAINKGKKL